MVKRLIVYIAFGLIISLYANSLAAQRLNLGVDIGTFMGTQTKTIFEDDPFYYLYAAPYSDLDYFGNQSNTYFNQVRLVRIWGVTSSLNANFRFGGNINFQSKNRLKIKLGFDMYNTSQQVYYSFQDLMINMDGNSEFKYNSIGTNEYSDDYISISKWINSYSLILSYEILHKSVVRPYVSVGFMERVQLYSSYSSSLTDGYVDENDVQYQNAKKFQDDLYRELHNDGFKHYLNFGLGIKVYSFDLSLAWYNSLGSPKSDYFISQSYWSLGLSYDIVSIPIFK